MGRIGSNVTNDVEKRWHDPRALRAAVAYDFAVVILAAALFAWYAFAGSAQILWAAAVPGVLFLGALGAFIKTYRDWRARRTWPIWHGAGWFLLTLTLLCFAFPAMAVQGMK
jgi:hypothetical protein